MAIGGILGASLLKFVIGPFWDKASSWADGYLEKRKEIDTAKMKIELAKAEAEAAVYAKQAVADIDWEARAQASQDSSWKDEYILVLWSLPLICIFIPVLQDHIKIGFEYLDSAAPDWYFQGWGVIVAAVYGAKKFIDAVEKHVANRHEQRMAGVEVAKVEAKTTAKVEAKKVLRPHQQSGEVNVGNGS